MLEQCSKKLKPKTVSQTVMVKGKVEICFADGWQLHLEPSINHHYEVFRVEIPEESFEISKVSCTNSKLL